MPGKILGWLPSLKLNMYGTLALLIGMATLIFVVVVTPFWGVIPALILALVFNVLMWISSPKIIESAYSLRKIERNEMPWLHEIVDRLSLRSGIKRPELMLAPTDVPNAFAYGNPFTGYKVAVTSGILKVLDRDELEAVIGHEIGHIKHGDMQIMMIASAIPAVFSLLGRIFLWSSYASIGDDRDNLPLMAAVGGVLLLVAVVLQLVSLRLSRLREFYADAHSAMSVDGGAEKLQKALVKISVSNNPVKAEKLSHFRPLMISDPLKSYSLDPNGNLIEKLKNREVSITERILGIFSTHPNITDRLRALDRLSHELS